MRLLGLLLCLFALPSFSQVLVNCAPATPCNAATGPANTNTGMPAWQAFGVLNGDFITLAPLFTTPSGDIIGNYGTGLANISMGGNLELTSSGTIATQQPINAQTGSTYTLLTTDAGKVITFTAAAAVALPAATGAGFGAGATFEIKNNSTGNVVVTPTTSTVNGASTLTLGPQTSCVIISDGTNYQTTACNAVASFTQPNVVSAAPSTSQNNYSPTGYIAGVTNQLILTPSAAINITGISAPAIEVDLYVFNASATYSITFTHESGSSSAGNQFVCQNAAPVVLQPFSGTRMRLIPNLLSSTAYWIFL